MKYAVCGIRKRDSFSKHEFWGFLRAYGGYGEFIPFEGGENEGEFNIWIELDEEVTLKDLRDKFPSLIIKSLEEIVA